MFYSLLHPWLYFPFCAEVTVVPASQEMKKNFLSEPRVFTTHSNEILAKVNEQERGKMELEKAPFCRSVDL